MFNKKIEPWHLLIVFGIITAVFLIPFRVDNLDFKDFRWIFLDRTTGERVDKFDVEGGFGVTSIPERLDVGKTLGTNLLAVLPEEYNIYIEFPKSEITLTHKTSLESDGVSIVVNNKIYKLKDTRMTITASSLIIKPVNTTSGDWVWFEGHRKQSLYENLMENYRTKIYLIPAQPFAIAQPAEIIVEKPQFFSIPLLALIIILVLISVKVLIIGQK